MRGFFLGSCRGLQPLASTEWPLGPKCDFARQLETFEKPLKIKGFSYGNIVIPLKVKDSTAKIFEKPLKVKGEMTNSFEMYLTN